MSLVDISVSERICFATELNSLRLYSWTLKFRKIVQQQMWCKVVSLILAFFETVWKMYDEKVCGSRREAARCFSSTISWAPSFTSSYFGFRFNNEYNAVLFSSAYPASAKNDVEPCCHKQSSLMRDRRQRLLWYTLPDGRNCWWYLPVIDAKTRYWSRIAIFAYPTCTRRPR